MTVKKIGIFQSLSLPQKIFSSTSITLLVLSIVALLDNIPFVNSISEELIVGASILIIISLSLTEKKKLRKKSHPIFFCTQSTQIQSSDITRIVLSYLNIRDKIHCVQISRRWNRLVKEDYAFRQLYGIRGLSSVPVKVRQIYSYRGDLGVVGIGPKHILLAQDPFQGRTPDRMCRYFILSKKTNLVIQIDPSKHLTEVEKAHSHLQNQYLNVHKHSALWISEDCFVTLSTVGTLTWWKINESEVSYIHHAQIADTEQHCRFHLATIGKLKNKFIISFSTSERDAQNIIIVDLTTFKHYHLEEDFFQKIGPSFHTVNHLRSHETFLSS